MKTLLTYQKLIVVLFAIVFTLTLHSVSDAQTYTHIHIDAVNGSNAPTGRGSAANPYKSITYALLISTKTNLPDPWHVHIHPGTYNADPGKPAAEREIFPLELRQEMIFEGTTTAAECIIDAQHLGETQVEILRGVDTEAVTIRNLTLQNMDRTDGAGGIVLWDSAGTLETLSRIDGCVVHNNGMDGVRTNIPLILMGNTFSNSKRHGVWTNKSISASHNTFSSNGSGRGREGALYIDGDSTGDLSENTFQNNRDSGLGVKGTLEGDLTYNTFIGNASVHYNRGGGGFYISGAFTGNISHNIFTENVVEDEGGGFYISGAFTGNISHNIFTKNAAEDSGGGFYISAAFTTGNISHNTFTENRSIEQSGGGFHIEGIVGGAFTSNISHNKFTKNSARYHGGGFLLNAPFIGNISHNIFDSNSVDSGAGGGFSLLRSAENTVEVFNNIFFNNTARDPGNSVSIRQPTYFMNNLFMISDELSEGISGAHTVWVNSPECRFHNNIFSGVKTAIYIGGTFDLPITHNLFHDIKADFISQAGSGIGNDVAFWELLSDGATDNLEGDPRLVDPVTTRDFHLQSTSPAIDAGTNAFAPADDLDGVTRPVGAIVDIGPYEYGGTPVVTTQDPPAEDTPRETAEDTPLVEPTLKLYWATGGKIQRGDLDGSNIEDVVNREAASIALDAMNGKIYWTHADDGIYRANLSDGTNIEHLVRDNIWSISGGRIALDVAGGKMYWTNGKTNSISRANLDGANPEELLKLFVGTPLDIALDVAGGKMYWTQWEGNASISRANLDGSDVELLINPGDRRGIALDVAGGKMYWTDGFDGIGMANLDGSNVRNFDTPDFTMGDVTLDLSNGRMYWVDGEGSELRRGNLNGSQQQTILNLRIYDIALYTPVVETEPPVKAYPAWDVNEDGKTDITDLVLVAAALGTSPPDNPRTDVNGDGTVNIQDLIVVATHLGESAAPAAPVIVALPERLTPETLQQVLDLLRMQNDGSVAFQHAITNVERLLASLMPKETALLANYPNPFNPETWIPYQLASPAAVTLHIHAIDGTLVRTLSLGHKATGIYQSRNRAAYWDGRNEVGESVASGVYFYTLTAGDFNATRKMLIRK